MKDSPQETRRKMVTELTRANLNFIGTVCTQELQDADQLAGADRDAYLAECENLWANPVFKNEIKRICEIQKEFIACLSEDFDQVLVGRGTINGVSLLLERIEGLHNEYVDSRKGEDAPVDEHSIIEPVAASA